MFKKIFHIARTNQLYALLHQLLMAGYGFTLLFLMVRMMPPHEVGRWLLFISVISISDILMHGLLQTIIVKESSSCNDDAEQNQRIQTNSFILQCLVLIVITSFVYLLKGATSLFHSNFLLLNDFSTWYPALGVSMLLYNLSWWVNMGRENFSIVLVQRIIYCVVSLGIILGVYFLYHTIDFQTAAFSQVAGYMVSSTVAYFINHFSFRLKYVSIEKLKQFLHYGKFNVGTMLGSSLLRNADIFMISAFMNTTATAIYSLAQKIIELFEVMLRSVAVTSLPVLFNSKNNAQLFSEKLLTRISFLTFLFIPPVIFVFAFSDDVIRLISGSNQYSVSASVLRVFVLYILLLPADRLIGVALEACNQPKLNLLKTILLIAFNIGGNFVALIYFKSIIAVAAVSSIALSAGIISGIYFLNSKDMLHISKFNWRLNLFKFKST